MIVEVENTSLETDQATIYSDPDTFVRDFIITNLYTILHQF